MSIWNGNFPFKYPDLFEYMLKRLAEIFIFWLAFLIADFKIDILFWFLIFDVFSDPGFKIVIDKQLIENQWPAI